MIHKWYRGHDGKQKATDNFGIIWITDDPEYAQLYADEYGNDGVVSVLYIDESKLNYADTYYDDDFDVWFPDMTKVKEYQKEGYNCYSFPVSIDGLDCDCIALFDESAIVKIEQINKNIMENKKVIRLTESKLKGIIEESVKQVLSELDWKTYMNAARKRGKQGHSMKSHDLASYAKEKFNQQHGYEDGDNRVAMDDLTGVSNRRKSVSNPTYREFIDDDGKHKSMTIGGWNTDRCETQPIYRDPSAQLQNAHQEYNDYMNGNYEYSQENGWKKKNK